MIFYPSFTTAYNRIIKFLQLFFAHVYGTRGAFNAWAILTVEFAASAVNNRDKRVGANYNDLTLLRDAVPSQSTILGALDSLSPGLKILKPYEQAYLDSVRKDSALLSGYLYKINDAVMDTFIRWLPGSAVVNHPTLVYSLLVDSPIVSHIIEAHNDWELHLAPNPASNVSYLRIINAQIEKLSVTLVDITGRVVLNVFNGMGGDQTTIPISTNKLSRGVYLVNVMAANGESRTLRLCKL